MTGPATNRLVRPMAVAGTFYPADPRDVDRELQRLFPGTNGREAWRAAIIPHAGWFYSAHVAAAVLSRLKIPESVLILCPKHRPGGAEWAVSPHDAWEIPGGQLDADTQLAEELARAVPGLELDATPHMQEHAIEVELPLLAHVAPQVKVVGITVGRPVSEHGFQPFVDGLKQIVQARGESLLLIVSSDMNHFATDKENRRLDAIAIDAMCSLDPQLLIDQCDRHGISMCGRWPAYIVLESLRELGQLKHCRQVAYATSADAGGDRHRVVGYAGLLFG